MLNVIKSRKKILCIVCLFTILGAWLLYGVIVNVVLPSMCFHEPWGEKVPGGYILDDQNVAYVKLKKKKRNAFSLERTVCTFEVIEWLNGGNGETRIQAYSIPYHDTCVKSEIEYCEKNYGQPYENGETYIISLVKDDDNKYLIIADIYIPLHDLRRSNCVSNLTFRDGTVKGENLASPDLLFYLREYYANRENGGETEGEAAGEE